MKFDCVDKGVSRWICRCECGTTRSVNGRSLRNGRSTSCGCHSKDFMKTRNIAETHGLKYRNIRLYTIWQNMLNRCRNPNVDKYPRYGGRGIKVCDEWHEYPPFYEWAMSSGYTDSMTIDRIDVNGNYEPSNCQWLTLSENSIKAAQDRRRICNSSH